MHGTKHDYLFSLMCTVTGSAEIFSSVEGGSIDPTTCREGQYRTRSRELNIIS